MNDLKQSLESTKIALEKRERGMKKEVQLLVATKMKKTEESLKETSKGLVIRYESALEQLSKENKRLQTSLKDMISTNRILRDQVTCRSV